MRDPTHASHRESDPPWLKPTPAHWKVQRLKFLTVGNDGGVWGSDYDDGGTLVLRSTDQTVDGFWRIEAPARRLLTETERQSALLRKGDLVVTKSSGSADHIGKTTMVDEAVEILGACFSNFMQRIRLTPGAVPKFYWYVFNSKLARAQFDYQSNTTTGLANLGKKLISELVVPKPEPVAQASIVAFLDRETARIDSLVEKKRWLLELLEEKRLAVITHAVTKGLDQSVPMKDSGIGWLGQIPAHWKVMAFNRACAIVSGQVDPRLKPYSEMPLIAPDHIESGTGRLLAAATASEQAAISGKYAFAKGDILYSKIRPELRKMYIAEFNGLCSADMYAIRHSGLLERGYLFYLLLSKYHHQYAILESLRVAMPKVNRQTLGAFRILVPPNQEQGDIISFISHTTDGIQVVKDREIRAIELLLEYRSALVTNAVTGNIDVTGSAQNEAAE